ncbi:hypothetical protein EX30DRAFT_234050 [Ascodesmis nigricans]|uniref:Uncharacterized protein n=1 Tax=Ascodesmis nigricans TaxID=341454 RepID=A0A4S2MYH1_9PEZI|nr:hypothetical protein EX30DRAFT_234050 [Ascodesmis nigricans]
MGHDGIMFGQFIMFSIHKAQECNKHSLLPAVVVSKRFTILRAILCLGYADMWWLGSSSDGFPRWRLRRRNYLLVIGRISNFGGYVSYCPSHWLWAPRSRADPLAQISASTCLLEFGLERWSGLQAVAAL